jgi:hypothetical protein
MEREPVDSSVLASVGHEDGVLEVEFTSGAVYRYFDVPVPVHEALMAAESHGSYFNAHVRDAYAYERV